MSETNPKNTPKNEKEFSAKPGISRRNFLKYAGASAVAATTIGLAGCGDNNPVKPNQKKPKVNKIAPTEGESGSLTISGKNLSKDAKVMVDGKKASVMSGSPIELVIKLPENLKPGTTVTIKITVNGTTITIQYTVSSKGMVSLGSDDIGILNYAYALEQLEQAFYAQVNEKGKLSGAAKAYFKDTEAHEVAHKDFLKTALGKKAIPGLTPDFSSVDFSSKKSILGTAKVFEDLGVAAYNGQGPYLKNKDYLLLAGKIVSLEGRHAASVRDLIKPGSASFAGDDIVDPKTGLGEFKDSKTVLSAVKPYIKESLDGSNLPDQSQS
jgi:hypothetical protein